MPISYSVDQQRQIIIESWTGEISAEVLESHWQSYLADPEVLALRRTLVDLRRCVIAFSGQQLAGLINSLVVPTLQGRHWKTAILVEAPVQLGVSRQYQVFSQSYSEDAIFYEWEAALDWLVREQGRESAEVHSLPKR